MIASGRCEFCARKLYRVREPGAENSLELIPDTTVAPPTAQRYVEGILLYTVEPYDAAAYVGGYVPTLYVEHIMACDAAANAAGKGNDGD